MKPATKLVAEAALVLGGTLIAATPALAGSTVPGPVLGAGAPALVAIGAGYWLIRRFRRG